MSEPTSVAEQIEANQQADLVQTERTARLAAHDPKDLQTILENTEFEGEDLSDADTALLQALLAQHAPPEEKPEEEPEEELSSLDEVAAVEDARLLALAEEALAPELESLTGALDPAAQSSEEESPKTEDFDPDLDNPMQPKGEEPELSEEDKVKLVEQQKKANRQTLKNNRRAAKEWISKKKGTGLLLGKDPDGSIHCLVLGDEEQISNLEIRVDSPLYQMMLALVLTHLPGASVNSQVMHAEQLKALNNVGNNLMAGLQATNNNVLQLVSFLKLKFPELQSEMTPMEQTKSGLLVPSAG